MITAGRAGETPLGMITAGHAGESAVTMPIACGDHADRCRGRRPAGRRAVAAAGESAGRRA
jgi:hypothetical protein